MNELTVLVEHQMLRKQLDMTMLKTVWLYILQQSGKQKVIKVMQKEWQAQQDEDSEEEEEEFSLNVEAFDNLREKIFDAFYSILQTAQQQAKQNVLTSQNKEQVVTTQNSQLVELLEHVLAHDEENVHTQLK